MEADELFWQLAKELYPDSDITRSTMMGFPCLRVDGAFFASLDHREQHLIVKFPAGRVNEIVQSGEGLPFAPNGRVFRERVAIPKPDEQAWRNYLLVAKAFIKGSS